MRFLLLLSLGNDHVQWVADSVALALERRQPHRMFALCWLSLMLTPAAAQTSLADTNVTLDISAQVTAVAMYAGGKVVIGGNFTRVIGSPAAIWRV